MFQFLTHVELPRSMAAILEMPQYVLYHKNDAFAFIKLSAKSYNFVHNGCAYSCPTNIEYVRWYVIHRCRVFTKGHALLR